MPSSSSPSPHLLFLNASTREPGHVGNTEWLARQAGAALPAHTSQTWLHLARLELPPFVDLRHTAGSYPAPEGDLRTLLDATLAASEIVFVSPVYWFSIPSPLKTYLDHWSAWMRVPGLEFKERMAGKALSLVTTSGDRAKAQPMIDSVELCARFLGMRFRGALWGKGGPPGAVQADAAAVQDAAGFLAAPLA
jgi:NAD(P)H-dependent FMN reductase